MFKKIKSENKTKYDNFYSSSKAEIIINKSDIDNVFQSIFTENMENIRKSSLEDSGWIIQSVIDHIISISKYNPLARSTYIKLPKELDHPRKGLINIQNTDDNECFKWCLVRYLNPADHHPAKVTKADKDFPKRLDFKNIIFQPKLETFTKLKIKKKKRIPLTLVFLAMKIKKNIQYIYQKNVLKKNMLFHY